MVDDLAVRKLRIRRLQIRRGRSSGLASLAK